MEAVTLVAYVCARQGAPAGLLDDLKEFMRSAPPRMRPRRFYLTARFLGNWPVVATMGAVNINAASSPTSVVPAVHN
jgi:hypothetical protein